MTEACALYGVQRLVYCTAVSEARFCIVEVCFFMAEAHGSRGFPPSSAILPNLRCFGRKGETDLTIRSKKVNNSGDHH